MEDLYKQTDRNDPLRFAIPAVPSFTVVTQSFPMRIEPSSPFFLASGSSLTRLSCGVEMSHSENKKYLATFELQNMTAICCDCHLCPSSMATTRESPTIIVPAVAVGENMRISESDAWKVMLKRSTAARDLLNKIVSVAAFVGFSGLVVDYFCSRFCFFLQVFQSCKSFPASPGELIEIYGHVYIKNLAAFL